MVEHHDLNPRLAAAVPASAADEPLDPRFVRVDSSNAGYFTGLSVDELGARLRGGEVTAVAVVQAALDSIARLNPTLKAFVHVDSEGARRQGHLPRLACSRRRD